MGMGALIEFKPKNAENSDIHESGDVGSAGSNIASADASGVSPSPTDDRPSEHVVAPIPGKGALTVVLRGSPEHRWAFNYLKDKGLLQHHCDRFPGFLPLSGGVDES